MTVATPEDVAVALGRPISQDSDEYRQVAYWLSGAELQIKHRLGDVSALDQATVRWVEVEAVTARLQNPDGLQSETVDDYTYRYGSESRRVTISDEWWALLIPRETSAGAFTIRTRSRFM